MKVVKFGGSSLASAIQLEKVFKIVQEDEERKYVIVSALENGMQPILK